MKTNRAIKRGDEGERIVSDLIAKDSSFHYLINNLVLLGDNKVSHQIDHIYIRSNGIFVIETKNYYGEITGQEEDSFWKRTYFVKRVRKTALFHNPLKQNQSHIKAIKRIIGKDYPIYCFVVFIQNNAKSLDLFNVCNLDDLLKRINLITSDNPLSKEVMTNIYQKLLYFEADVSNEEHIENVKSVNKERKEAQKKLRMAIEKKICPDCGGILSIVPSGLKCTRCNKLINI